MTKPVITLVEDENGIFHPHLNGVRMPGVVEVELNWTAESVRTATIKILLFGRQFELVSAPTVKLDAPRNKPPSDVPHVRF